MIKRSFPGVPFYGDKLNLSDPEKQFQIAAPKSFKKSFFKQNFSFDEVTSSKLFKLIYILGDQRNI